MRTLPACDWCDPAGDADAARIAGDPAAADRLVRELRLESALRVALRTQRRPARRRLPLMWPAAAAAAAALLAAALWWTLRPDPRLPLLDGRSVAAGDEICVQAGARLAWRDGSAVILGAGARVRIAAPDAPEALRLLAGTVQAEVAAQPAGRVFRIAAAEATCEVLGTLFDLRRDDGATRLQVQRGRVRLATAEQAVEARAGEGGLALADGALLALPRAGRLLWRAEGLLDGALAAGGHSPLGEAAMVARAQRAQAIVFGPHARGSPLFTWRRTAELRFSYRCDGPVPWMGVWIRSPDRAGPNHYLALPTPRPGRWATASLRLDAIPPLRAAAMPRDGAAVSWLHIQAGWAPEASLQVAGLRLEEP